MRGSPATPGPAGAAALGAAEVVAAKAAVEIPNHVGEPIARLFQFAVGRLERGDLRARLDELVAGRRPQEHAQAGEQAHGGRAEGPGPDRRPLGRGGRRRHGHGHRRLVAPVRLDARGKGVEGRHHEAAQIDRLLLDRRLDAPAPVRRQRDRRGRGSLHARAVSDLDGYECRLGQVAPIGQQVQLVENFRHVHRPHLFRQNAHGAECARLPDVQLAFLRGVHHDGNHRGLRVALDRLDRLQAVHPRHEMIHEDGVGAVMLEIFDRLLGRFGHVDFDVVLLEHAAQDDASRFGIIDD